MNRIVYVKAVHGPTKEEYGEAQILTCDDVSQILDRKLQVLNSTIDRLEQESREQKKRIMELEQNRNWLWEDIGTIKRFLVGEVETAAEKMKNYSADNHTVLGGLDLAWDTRGRVDKLPDACRDIFANVITECLTSKLETFGRQIANLESQITRTEKIRDKMAMQEAARFSNSGKRKEASKVSWFSRMIHWFGSNNSAPDISEGS